MRHRKAGYKLGRTTAHRTAMLRNMAASLFEHGQITTTIPTAKALQPFVEKIVTKAKKGDLHNRRQVISMLGGDRRAFAWSHIAKDADENERQAVETLRERAEVFFDIPDADQVERNRYGELRKAPKLVKHIFENIAPRFEDRDGGYTRIIKLGRHRLGDAGEICVIQFCGAEDGPEVSGEPSGRRRQADRRTAFAEKLAASRPSAAEPETATAVAEPDAEPDAEAGTPDSTEDGES